MTTAGVASRVGAAGTRSYAVISLSDRLKPWDVIAAPDRRGRRRPGAGHLQPGFGDPHLVGAMRELLLAHRDPGIPVVIGRVSDRFPDRMRDSGGEVIAT